MFEVIIMPEALKEALEDLHDLQTLEEAREAHADAKGVPLSEIGKRLGY